MSINQYVADVEEVEIEPDGIDNFFPKRKYNEKSLTGKVNKVYFASDTFTAGVLSQDDIDPIAKDVRFSINDFVEYGQVITLVGEWTNDPKWGWQFKATGIKYPEPEMTVKGLAEYLADNKEFSGIGPKKAILIAEKFAANFDFYVRECLDEIKSAASLTDEQAQTLREVWCLRSDVNAISAALAEYGLTANQINKIAKQYGNKALDILRANPYILHQTIDGIGFLRNDEIALKMGVEPMNPDRLRAGVEYFLDQAHNDTGHTCVILNDLIAQCISKLYLDDLAAADTLRNVILSMVEQRKLRLVKLNDSEYIGTERIFQQEEYVRQALMLRAGTDLAAVLDKSKIDAECAGLTDEQRSAVMNALSKPASIITGGAGTGKSHTIKTIVRLVEQAATGTDLMPVICAPTGKAAKRLQIEGLYARTIHRTLEYSSDIGGFVRNESLPLDAVCVIVDEVSMCSVELLSSLVKATPPEANIILVGDYNQLPPIGPGNTLRDYVDNELIPVTRLTKCHRNAGKLKHNCLSILDGQFNRQKSAIDKSIEPPSAFAELYKNLADNTPAWNVIDSCADNQKIIDLLCLLQRSKFAAWGFDPIMDCQIIAPQRTGPVGICRINRALQAVHQANLGRTIEPDNRTDEKYTYYMGDKIMQIKNDYNINVMNGTPGIIRRIYRDTHPDRRGAECDYYTIQFDDAPDPIDIPETRLNITLAYAVTVHKVQGSQYPCVVSVIHKSNTYMLSRNLLYTAVSRAQFSSIILGDTGGMTTAIRKQTDMSRRTWTELYARRNGKRAEMDVAANE